MGAGALEVSVGRGVLAATALPVEISLTASFLMSSSFASPEAVAAALFSAALTGVLACP